VAAKLLIVRHSRVKYNDGAGGVLL